VATPELLRDQSHVWRAQGMSVGLVPTMGALHAGHVSLIERAHAENDRTIVSVFVNPLQFVAGEDFERYPRPLEKDLDVLRGLNVDAAYVPRVDSMYPPGAQTRVKVRGLEDLLEGVHRPGHFEGVATVVTKLLNAAVPDRVYFGEKDAQQALLVTRMARDLDVGVTVRVLPTVREQDGLALSSRNVYLDGEQRKAATVLHRALEAADEAYAQGRREPADLRAAMRAVLDAEPLAKVDYAEVVDPDTFGPPKPGVAPRAVLAVRIGRVRLIDNLRLGAGPEKSP
jgi:pantoate--beta-alanine ligase